MRTFPVVALALCASLVACGSNAPQTRCAQPPCGATDGPLGSTDGPLGSTDDGGSGDDGLALGVPTVVSVIPPSGSTIGLGRAITITFSTAMDPTSLALGSAMGSVASAAWTSPSVLVLTPMAGWPASANASDTKTLSLDDQSSQGVALATASLSYVVDGAAPTIVSVAPPSGSTINGTQAIVIHLSESIAPTSLTGLDGTMAARIGTTAFSQTTAPTDTLTITPGDTGWADGSGQTLTLRTELSDLYGNVMNGQTLTFTVDATAPTLTTAAPTSGSLIDWGQAIVLTFSEPISSTPADTNLGGSLLGTYTAGVSGATLTLTPNPHWSIDSARTLSVTVHDLHGNASAAIPLSYDVVDGAIYVRKNGSDANRGTLSFPKITIGAGITAAAAFYPSGGSVRVAAGDYQENIVVPSGINLYGGYNPADWTTTPSRTGFVTEIEDPRGALASNPDAVLLKPNTLIQRFKIVADDGATGTCSAVRLDNNLTGMQSVIDNELDTRNCTYLNNSVRATFSLNMVQILDNTMTGNTTTGDNKIIELAITNGANPNILIDGNDMRASLTTVNENDGVVVEPNPGAPASGTVIISNNYIHAGATAAVASSTYGAHMTVNNLNYVFDHNRIHGGLGQAKTYGIYISASSNLASITRNAVHGGEPQLDGKSVVGVYMTGSNVKLWNNLITGGGRVDAGITKGSSDGVWLFTNGASVLNNTIHQGFLAGGACLDLNAPNTVIENNILFAANFLAGGTIEAVKELISATSPTQFRNNRVQGFGSGSAYVYVDYVASAGTCPGFANYSCYSNEVDLNTAANTTGGSAGTAAGNTVGAAGFQDVDGPDNLLQTMFDSNGNLENQWQLANSSVIKTTGLDGGPAGQSFGFTNDLDGNPRTGDGTTGWSIGAYENDH